jgi:hypothetical protein
VQTNQLAEESRMKNNMVLLFGILAVIYLLNPGAGIFEILPDNLPIVGNLDEAAAAGILIYCLKYFKIDPGTERLLEIFRRAGPWKNEKE